MNQPVNTKDLLHGPSGPIIWSKVKALKEILNELVVQISARSKLEDPLEH